MAETALSIVIPIHNESETIRHCLTRLDKVLNTIDLSYEILFVDDGSDDNSVELLIQYRTKLPQIKIIRLSRNFGKEAALTAGLDYAVGEAAIFLDVDCQDPPELIPEMIKAWRSGADIVQMRRRSRKHDTALKRFSAYMYYRLLQHLSDCPIPVDTGDFQLINGKAIKVLRQLPENNRYMKGLLAWIGMKTTVIEYDREARASGKTKWSYIKLIGLALQGITSFSIAPLRYAMMLGIIAASIGSIYGSIIIFKTLLFGEIMRGFPSLIAIISFFCGIQLFSIGVLGEYIGKTYLESKKRPKYLIMEEIGISKAVNPYQQVPLIYEISQNE